MFRGQDGWPLLITINHDHVRGSGFPVPSGVVPLLGLAWDEERLLPSAVGLQAVRWRAQQPTLGTIRRLVEHHGSAEGDRVLLVFTDDGRFDYRPVPPVDTAAGPLHTALSLTGADPVATEAEALAGLAAAVDMAGETRPRRVLSAYRRKHDADIVEALEKAWL